MCSVHSYTSKDRHVEICLICKLATQIRDDMRESKTIREELKQARDQLQQQNQEIGDKHEEWKRAKEEMGKRMGEVESQLDRMEREKRRKVVIMGLDTGTGEQKQVIFRRESQSRG